MRKRIGGALAVATAIALSVPALAQAATLEVSSGAIRFVSDGADDQLIVTSVENGEQTFMTEGVTFGPGCHVRDESSRTSNPADAACTLAGVSRFEFVGGDGNDILSAWGTAALAVPVHADMGQGRDRFDLGSSGDDYAALGDGNDFGIDAAGNDTIDGGPGNDEIYGLSEGSGNDTILGGDGDDNLDGKDGDDTLDGGAGSDLTQGSPGNDSIDGGPGNDLLASVGGGGCSEDPGDDRMSGGPGDDQVCGGSGADVLDGGEDDDLLDGGAGDDSLGSAGLGSAQCSDDPGDDRMSGGAGNDQICGGSGVDSLDGGDGDDSVTSLDAAVDNAVACGAGADVLWADAFDPVSLDCERQGVNGMLALSRRPLLPVTLPCGAGSACRGRVAVFAAPRAARPVAGEVPARGATPVARKALARASFKLRATSRRTLRLRIGKATAKRLARRGGTILEARTTFTQGGRRYAVRRTFVVGRR